MRGADAWGGTGAGNRGWEGELQPFPRKWEERGCRSLQTIRHWEGSIRATAGASSGKAK